MEQVLPPTTACSVCHEPLIADGTCLICLLSIGLSDEAAADNSVPPAPPEPTGIYGDFEIACREDGSLWELGRGAMGVTYKALDRVLHRAVALKVIQLCAADSAEGWRNAALRERFLREARAAAALRHPNVAGVLQFGASNEASRCYCAMELIEGETLEARVRRIGPLPAKTVVEIGRQVLAALVAAAERGLVHRDLKPGNLMLTERSGSPVDLEVKVIDFGLAQAAADASRPGLLPTGFVGTPAFASPEQLASQPVDARSDLYSLGVALWYALSGRVPFTGRTLEDLRHQPARTRLPVEELRTKGVPDCVSKVLRWMLEVDPADRPASAQELQPGLDACQRQLSARELPFIVRHRWMLVAASLLLLGGAGAVWVYHVGSEHQRALHEAGVPASAGPAVPEKSVAVLPFESLSADKDNAFFTDGVQDEVLADLAKVADLKVIGRTSVNAYGGNGSAAPRDLRAIGLQLGVAHILKGSVQRAGNQVRVFAELVDARTGTHRWAMHYDRPLDDVFAIQSEIAQTIADQLRARISPEEHAEISQVPTKDVLAFQLYQEARELKGHNSDPSAAKRLYKAVDLASQATQRDPQFLRAWCLLGEVQLDIYWEGLDRTDARRESAREAVEQAVRLQPDAGETHLVQAIYDYHGLSDYPRALDELTLARRTLPNYADVPFYSAAVYRRQGRWEDAVREFRLAAELDPRNFSILSETAHTEEAMEDYAEATQRYNQALAVNPGDVYTRERLALIPLFSRADPLPLHTLNVSLLAAEPGAAEASAYFRLRCALAERDRVAARAALANFPAGGFQVTGFFVPPEWYAGLTARTFGDETEAHAAFLLARAKVEQTLRDHPDFGAAWSVLGWIDAGLGRKEEAIREGQRACELVPSTKDAYTSPDLVGYLAMIYAWNGEKNLALQTLAEVVHARVGLSSNTRYGSLKLDPQWDPLRGDPRFEALVRSLAPKL